MPFRVACPGCQTSYELPDTLWGQRVRCKHCKDTFQAAPPPAEDVKEAEEILDALPGAPAEDAPVPGRGSREGEYGPPRGRRPRAQDAEEADEQRSNSGSSAGLVIVLAAAAVGLFLALTVGGAAVWVLYMRRDAPGPAPTAVVSAAPSPSPTPAVPAPPVAWRVQADPAPAPAAAPAGRQRISLPGAPGPVPAVYPATTASRVLLLGRAPDREIQGEVWDLERVRRLNQFSGRLAVELPMTLSPDGAYWAGREEGTTNVKVYRTDNGAEVRSLPGGPPHYLAFATGTRLVIGRAKDNGRRYEQVDLAGAAPPAVEVEHAVEPDGEALSPGGRYLAVLGDDKVSIYELADGTLAGELPLLPLAPAERRGLASGVAFSPDGRQLAVLRSKADEIHITRHDVVANRAEGGVILGRAEVARLCLGRLMAGERLQWLPGRNGWMVHGTFCVEPETQRPIPVPGRKGSVLGVMPRVVSDRHVAVVTTQGPAPELTLQRLPAEELEGRPAPPESAGEELSVPPDPPAAVAVDWSGVERVMLPDAAEARGVAADPAPTLEAAPKQGPFALETRADEVHDLLFPRARAQAVVVSSRQAGIGKRVVRVERVDLASGKGLGTISLYGRTIPGPIGMYAPPAAVSPNGSLFAQIDINGRQRIDVWSLKDGKHLVGFVAPAGPTEPAGGAEGRDLPRPPAPRGSGGGLLARDVAFVDDEHLLVLSSPSIDSSPGQVVLWKLPEVKPVYRFDGTGMPYLSLSPGGKYLAADTRSGYALLETRTGKVVGGLPFPKERVLKAGMTGFDRGGTRFAAEISLFGHGALPEHQLVSWDIGKGTLSHSFGIQMPLLRRGLQWLGDSAVFMGGNLMSLEHRRVLVRYTVAGALATSSPDGRLWYTAAPNEKQPAFLYARRIPDDAVRKVTEALREKKPVPFGADFVPLTGEK